MLVSTYLLVSPPALAGGVVHCRKSHNGMHAAAIIGWAHIQAPGACVYQECFRQTYALLQDLQTWLRSDCSRPVQECFLSTWQLLLLVLAPHSLNWLWGYLPPPKSPQSPLKTSSKRQSLYLLLDVVPMDGETVLSGKYGVDINEISTYQEVEGMYMIRHCLPSLPQKSFQLRLLKGGKGFFNTHSLAGM